MVIPFKNEKLLNIIILKNGFSSLGAIYGKLYQNKEYAETDNIWEMIWPEVFNWYRNASFKDIYEYRNFFVWRDPYKRFISMYTDIVTANMNHNGFFKHLNVDRESLLDIDNFVNICLPKIDLDMHLFPQYKMLLLSNIKPDFMVLMEDLTTFIYKELGVKYNKVHNKSNKNIDISGFEKYKEDIRNAYAADYKLLDLYNIWQNDGN